MRDIKNDLFEVKETYSKRLTAKAVNIIYQEKLGAQNIKR